MIDCLEFNPKFRGGDVALDIAFLVMELRAAGRAELGEYFVHRFVRETGDHALYPLLDFYCAYRALVRAKIACLIAGDSVGGRRQAAAQAEEARSLLALTEALENGSPDRPLVLAIGGQVASGKSTLAEALAERFGLPVVSSDVTRKSLAGLPATQPGARRCTPSAFTEQTYAEHDPARGTGAGWRPQRDPGCHFPRSAPSAAGPATWPPPATPASCSSRPTVTRPPCGPACAPDQPAPASPTPTSACWTSCRTSSCPRMSCRRMSGSRSKAAGRWPSWWRRSSRESGRGRRR